MSTKLLIAATAAILAASPALAATQAASKSHAAAITSEKTKMHHHHRMARKVSMRGDAEVRALNVLEAAGYRQFNDLHARGRDFLATASKAGKFYDVTVMPSGSINANIA